MTKISHRVLIVYNQPLAGQSEARPFAESESGVLDEVRAVARALTALHIPHRQAPVREFRELAPVLLNAPEEIVFNLIEGFDRGPEDACLVPAVCRVCGKGFTGTATPGLLLSMDKWQSKAILQASRVPCPQAVLVPIGHNLDPSSLFPGPWIVKPTRADASEGIDNASVVHEPGPALAEAVLRVHTRFGQSAMVEQFIDGREINVSVLWRDDAPAVLPLAEIDFSAFDSTMPRIVGYDAKWIDQSFAYNHTSRIIPAPLPPELADRIREIALEAVRVLDCHDYARVDFRIDPAGNPFVLEVNSNPDIAPDDGAVDAGFPAALAAANIPYVDFIAGAVRCAAERLRHEQAQPESLATTAEEEGLDHPPAPGSVSIRCSRPEDRVPILRMLQDTAFFRPDELDVAQEVLDDALLTGAAGHYQSYVAEQNGSAVGWVCFGIVPCTLGTYDVYWIVVAPSCQRAGIGKRLMERVESVVALRKGRQILIETSGRDVYKPTRSFYSRIGYSPIARVPGFYAPQDDLVIFGKTLPSQ